MPLQIDLLGRPTLARDGSDVRLEGRKTWALLAYLILESRPPMRRDLVDRLWSGADDPFGALRWTLSQVRRAIAPDALIIERDGRLQLEPRADVRIDVRAILEGAWNVDDPLERLGQTLLDGLEFEDEAPLFATWLALQRARVLAAATEAMRWSATLLARRDPARALGLAERALLTSPYDDALHELIVDIHVQREDRAAAASYVEQVAKRYRADLGLGPPATIARPLDRPTPPTDRPLVRLDIRARAVLDAAAARLDSGDYASAREMAQRAAADAAASGDRALEARALILLAKTLIHSLKGSDHEALGLLGRALQLATEVGDTSTLADIECERGFVSFLDARYGAAEPAFLRAIALADEAADPVLAARATVYLGLAQSDRCEYGVAEDNVRDAIARLERTDAGGLRAYAMACLARLLLRTGRTAEARRVGDEAVRLATTSGALSLVPWPMVHAAEATMSEGDVSGAAEQFAQAFTLGCEISDPCWEGLSLRGLALVESALGTRERAIEILKEALAHVTRLGDTYRWAEALILADLVEVERGADQTHVEQGLAIALAAPMPDLVARLARYRAHTPAHTVAS